MPQKIAVTLLAAAGLAAAASAAAEDCAHKAAREALLDAGGARSVRIEAAAGELRIEGKAGLVRVEARGTACAPTAGAPRPGAADRDPGRRHGRGQGGDAGQLLLGLERILPAARPHGAGAADGGAEGQRRQRLGHRHPRRPARDPRRVGRADDQRRRAGTSSSTTGRARSASPACGGTSASATGRGRLLVKDVRGSVTVEEDGSGEIEIDTVTGDVTVERDGVGRASRSRTCAGTSS